MLDIVPNHMGVSDENRWWADERERARVFDYDPDDGWYRRFFDIDDLAGVRVEDPEVFELVHGKVLELVRDGVVDGLRVDHPDGLADPAGYLARLRDAGAAHVWVEKILHTGEPLRDWPVEGTVGYEFLNDAAALFVDPAGEAALARLPRAGEPFDEVAARAQLEQATTTFAREVERLRELLDIDGIPEALAALPIYRTYVEPWSGRVEEADRARDRRRRRRPPRRRAGAARARPRRVRHALSADLAADHGQGDRGHRLLPPPAAARAQRGRRRPGALRALGRRLPRRQRGAAPSASRAGCS